MIRTAVLALLLALPACKSPGDISLDLDFPDTCEAATHVQVYFIRGGLCSDCECGECLASCDSDNCSVGCRDGYCSVDQLDTGLAATPPGAGNYAVVYQLLNIAGDGRVEEVALTCADGVQLDKDGTASGEARFSGTCCPAQNEPNDAGTNTDMDAGTADSGS